MRRRTHRREMTSLALAFGVVLIAIGALGLWSTASTGGRQVASGTRVAFADGEATQCSQTAGKRRCLYLVELDAPRAPNACPDRADPVWRNGACWPGGPADESQQERRTVARTAGVAIGDHVEIVYDPNDRSTPGNITGAAGRRLPIGVLVIGGTLVGGAFWRRSRTSTANNRNSKELTDE